MNRLLASGRVFVAGCALALGCSFPSAVPAFEREPVTGGMIAVPGQAAGAPAAAPAQPELLPEPAAEPAPAVPPSPAVAEPAPAPTAYLAGGEDDTTWGIVLRGGYFGMMDEIADRLFRQHPKISGQTYGAEYRYHGEGGGRGATSVGVAFDYCTVSADGIWQSDETHAPESGGGDMKLLTLTVTGYASLLPSWYVHPYVGIGIGAGYAEGSYRDGSELVKVTYLVPVLHVPVGLAVEVNKRLQLAVEARFLDGVTLGGSLQLRF